MTIISAGGGLPPVVRVTAMSGYQVRILFTAALARKLQLGPYSHVTLHHDEPARALKFVPHKKQVKGAFRLLNDGGKDRKMSSRVVLVTHRSVPFLSLGDYEPTVSGAATCQIKYGTAKKTRSR